jgi:hypothetical protein
LLITEPLLGSYWEEKLKKKKKKAECIRISFSTYHFSKSITWEIYKWNITSNQKTNLIMRGLSHFKVDCFLNSFAYYFFGGRCWSLNSGPHICYTGILPLEPLHQPYF